MIFNRKIVIVGLLCFWLVLGFISPVMAEGEEEQAATASAVTLTDDDKDTISFLRETKPEDWHSGTLANPGIVYEAGIGIYIVNEQPMYILKGKVDGSGLPVRETTVTRGNNKIAIGDFLQKVNAGEITEVQSITYSRNKSNGMLVATEIVLK